MKKNLLIILFLLLNISNMYPDRYIKIASIDFGYIFKNYSATKLVRLKLKRLRNKVLQRIKRERNQLKKLIYNYKRDKKRYSELEKRWRFSEIKIKRARLTEKIEYYKNRLKIIEKKYTINFAREIYLATKKIAKKKGFSIVVKKNVILHADGRYNLTQFVLNYLERKLRGEKRE